MNRLHIILIFCLFAGAVPAGAQSAFTKETFYLLERGDTTRISAALCPDNNALASLRLDPVNFPTVTLPRSILEKVVLISNRKGSVEAAMLEETRLLRERDTLNNREIATLRSILAVQQKNIETCEQTNLLLNRSIQSLNGQLEASRDLVKSANNQKSGGKLMGILIGGGLGLGLGILLGVAVN